MAVILLTTIGVSTVTIALPPEVPVQLASDTAVTVKLPAILAVITNGELFMPVMVVEALPSK